MLLAKLCKAKEKRCYSEFNNLDVLETIFSQDQRYFTFIYLTTFGQSKIAYFASYDPPEFLTLVNTYCRQSITKCWIGGSVKKSSRPSLNVNNLSLSLWGKVVSEAEIIYVSSGVPAHLVGWKCWPSTLLSTNYKTADQSQSKNNAVMSLVKVKFLCLPPCRSLRWRRFIRFQWWPYGISHLQ